ncbi:UNVERIFIED_CONTAM: hypothetical protein FKN15_058695 [Acipenser sinensis]
MNDTTWTVEEPYFNSTLTLADKGQSVSTHILSQGMTQVRGFTLREIVTQVLPELGSGPSSQPQRALNSKRWFSFGLLLGGRIQWHFNDDCFPGWDTLLLVTLQGILCCLLLKATWVTTGF